MHYNLTVARKCFVLYSHVTREADDAGSHAYRIHRDYNNYNGLKPVLVHLCTLCALATKGMYACQNFVSEIAKIRFKDFFTYLTLLSAKPFDVGENLAIEIFLIPNEFKTSRKVLLEKQGPLADKIFLTLKKGKIAYLEI